MRMTRLTKFVEYYDLLHLSVLAKNLLSSGVELEMTSTKLIKSNNLKVNMKIMQTLSTLYFSTNQYQ